MPSSRARARRQHVSRFADTTYASRIGWREIVVTARDGAAVLDSSAPAVSRSDELRAYPKSLLRSPLDVRTAHGDLPPWRGRGVRRR